MHNDYLRKTNIIDFDNPMTEKIREMIHSIQAINDSLQCYLKEQYPERKITQTKIDECLKGLNDFRGPVKCWGGAGAGPGSGLCS